VCLPLLISPCTIKSRSSLLAPVHPGGPRQRAAKRLWCGVVVGLYCGQTAGWIKMSLDVELGLDTGHVVLDGDPALAPRKGDTDPQFSAHVYCGRTAGWINMGSWM